MQNLAPRLLTILSIGLLLLAAACQAAQPAPATPTPLPALPSPRPSTPTAAPSATPTLPPPPAASPTPAPTASPTPEPIQPFTWNGAGRPLLLAHYMPWYQSQPVSGAWGYHWTINHFQPTQKPDGTWENLASHFTPLTGPYDSNDPALLEYQLMLMKLSGIDGVIVDWYGIEDFWDYGAIHTATTRLFTAVKKAGLKFAVCYEDQTLRHMLANNHLRPEDALSHGQKVMAYLQANWFQDPAYLRVAGRPLLFVFGPQFFKDDADWKTVFSGLSPQPQLVALDNTYIPSEEAAFPWPPMSASKSGVLSTPALQSYLNDFYDKAQSWPLHIGGAFPGFFDIYQEAGVGSSYGFLDARDGRTFRLTLQSALDHSAGMIQLITWNDYGEGTNIEPTLEYQYRYLEILQELNQVLTGAKSAFTPQDLRLPLMLYALRQKPDQDQTALDQAVQALFQGDPAPIRALAK